MFLLSYLCFLSLSFFIPRMVEYSLDLQNINLSAIRTVRVLRPLKAINRVPSKYIWVRVCVCICLSKILKLCKLNMLSWKCVFFVLTCLSVYIKINAPALHVLHLCLFCETACHLFAMDIIECLSYA